MGSVRVNLSLSGKVYMLVHQAAESTGRSHAAVVMEALGWYLPQLRRNLDGGKAIRVDAMTVVPSVISASVPAGLTRQQRRHLERQQRKAST